MRPHRAAEPSERVVECADRLLPRCCVSRRNRFEVLAHHRGQRGIPVNRYLAYLPDDFIGNPQRNVQCRLSPSVDCTIIRLTRNTAPGQHCTGPFFPLSCPSPDDPHRATPNPPAVAESPLRFDYHPLDAWRPAALPPGRCRQRHRIRPNRPTHEKRPAEAGRRLQDLRIPQYDVHVAAQREDETADAQHERGLVSATNDSICNRGILW